MEVINDEVNIELQKKVNYQANCIQELKKRIEILEARNRDLELLLLSSLVKDSDFTDEGHDLSISNKITVRPMRYEI